MTHKLISGLRVEGLGFGGFEGFGRFQDSRLCGGFMGLVEKMQTEPSERHSVADPPSPICCDPKDARLKFLARTARMLNSASVRVA